MKTKEKVISVLESHEDDVALDVVIDRLYLLRKIERGIAQADSGDVIDHDEFMDQLEAEEPAKRYWTQQARDDLRAIRLHIGRDAPATASAYVRRLRESVGRLREFPFFIVYWIHPAAWFTAQRLRQSLLAPTRCIFES